DIGANHAIRRVVGIAGRGRTVVERLAIPGRVIGVRRDQGGRALQYLGHAVVGVEAIVVVDALAAVDADLVSYGVLGVAEVLSSSGMGRGRHGGEGVIAIGNVGCREREREKESRCRDRLVHAVAGHIVGVGRGYQHGVVGD